MEQYLLTMSSHGYNSFSAPTLLSLERTLWMNGPIDEQQSFQLVSALLYLDSLDCTEITCQNRGSRIRGVHGICHPLRRNTGKTLRHALLHNHDPRAAGLRDILHQCITSHRAGREPETD